MRDITVVTPYGPLFFRLDPKQPAQAGMLKDFQAGTYEPVTWQFLCDTVKPGFQVVDVGAHIGVFTALCAVLGASVTAFEPHPKNRGQLLRTIRDNSLANVAVRKQVCSDVTGAKRFHWNADNDGGHAIYDVGRLLGNPKSRKSPKSQMVESVRLDDVVARCDLIKLDVEGAEFHALQGAERLLRECKPVVVAEVNAPGLLAMGTCEADWRKWMRDLGYREFALLDSGKVPLAADETASNVMVVNGQRAIPVWNVMFCSA